MKKGLILIVLFLLFFSCTKRDDKILIDNVPFKNIYSKELPINFFLAYPYQLIIVDTLLLIMDNVDDYMITVCDVQSGELINRVIKGGQGPDEVLLPISIDISSDNKTFMLLQRQNGIYTQYNLIDLINGKVEPESKFDFKQADRAVKVENGFITAGPYETGMFSRWDNNGNLINVVDTYPDYIETVGNSISKYILNQGYIAYNDSSKVLFFASYFTGDMISYRLDEEFVEVSKLNIGNDKLKKKIENTGNTVISGEDIVHCFGIYKTTDNFYVLYSGEQMKNVKEAKSNFILKFDANGELKDCYKTDVGVESICVSEETQKIYAVALSQELEYVIVEFSYGNIAEF